MLKLCGFPASNYHNKVKLTLLEKGIPFEEVLVRFDSFASDSTFKATIGALSPVGKVPTVPEPPPRRPGDSDEDDPLDI